MSTYFPVVETKDLKKKVDKNITNHLHTQTHLHTHTHTHTLTDLLWRSQEQECVASLYAYTGTLPTHT